ncbi:dethiobiotin synthase [Gordonia sp. Swx-4]|uniref:dethiobiotin synthase n=1 Tax=unclassified Gordonia (in: high G+C Gram-positive bacteria) TaxID=2657482 RepID=UPI0012BB42A4|nr:MULTISPECIES: dethiobiotin synthase [unclassified Gordonia (in: high G+C Gram-positive bacteria)]QGP88694.1 ATP-dependent dethiobiotin synthetase BioD [Gordonia sp. 135]WJG11919.1 dethiobiotin synthase [Gordonia sp. Swx-4]
MNAQPSPARGRVLAVTGTSTDVGKTVVTAALAAAGRMDTVAICKPVQTGIAPTEPGDLAEVVRLAGDVSAVESYRYPEPLAPDTAARRAGMPLADPSVIVRAVDDLAATHDLTLVEGAGGVLVRLGESATILDIAAETLVPDTGDGVVIVVAPGLGALNHAELTVNAVRARGLRPAGLVIGWWPEEPDLAMRCNRSDLPRITGVPVVGVLPAGAASLDPAEFRRTAPTWFDPHWLAGSLTSRPASFAHTP